MGWAGIRPVLIGMEVERKKHPVRLKISRGAV
jgi:hypothetical protein